MDLKNETDPPCPHDQDPSRRPDLALARMSSPTSLNVRNRKVCKVLHFCGEIGVVASDWAPAEGATVIINKEKMGRADNVRVSLNGCSLHPPKYESWSKLPSWVLGMSPTKP